jgi:hypothetical protein
MEGLAADFGALHGKSTVELEIVDREAGRRRLQRADRQSAGRRTGVATRV